MRLFTITISAAIILLFLSYLAIHREMKRNDHERKRREKLIGELQESNEANEKLIKLRRNLIQNVTHELRTPLTAISGNAELLLNDTEVDSRLRHAQIIHDAAGRMAGMINQPACIFQIGQRQGNAKRQAVQAMLHRRDIDNGVRTVGKEQGTQLQY